MNTQFCCNPNRGTNWRGNTNQFATHPHRLESLVLFIVNELHLQGLHCCCAVVVGGVGGGAVISNEAFSMPLFAQSTQGLSSAKGGRNNGFSRWWCSWKQRSQATLQATAPHCRRHQGTIQEHSSSWQQGSVPTSRWKWGCSNCNNSSTCCACRTTAALPSHLSQPNCLVSQTEGHM